MATAEREKLYECEVERRRVKQGGGYEPFWKVKSVTDTIVDADAKFRCKDCHGEVKLHKSNKVGGPAPHAEHKKREDSEYCAMGMWFRKATDGREARESSSPVQ